MIVARQFFAWYRFNREIRPVGHGLILTHGWFVIPIVARRSDPNHTVPYGTVPFSHGFQAMNCLASAPWNAHHSRWESCIVKP